MSLQKAQSILVMLLMISLDFNPLRHILPPLKEKKTVCFDSDLFVVASRDAPLSRLRSTKIYIND